MLYSKTLFFCNNVGIFSTVEITENFEITTHESIQESSSTGFMPTLNLSQVGALMGGTVSIFIVIIIIIIVVFVVIHFVSKRKLKKRREFVVDVAITSGPTQEEGEFACNNLK